MKNIRFMLLAALLVLSLAACHDSDSDSRDQDEETMEEVAAVDPANELVVGVSGDMSLWRGTSGSTQVPTTLTLEGNSDVPDHNFLGELTWPGNDVRLVRGWREGNRVDLILGSIDVEGQCCADVFDEWELDFMGDTMVGTGFKLDGENRTGERYMVFLERAG